MQSDLLKRYALSLAADAKRYAAGNALQEPAYTSLTERKNELHHQKH
jgi:hypothetical protein